MILQGLESILYYDLNFLYLVLIYLFISLFWFTAQMVPFKGENKIICIPVVVAVSFRALTDVNLYQLGILLPFK